MSRRGSAWRKGGESALWFARERPKPKPLHLEVHSGLKRVLILSPEGKHVAVKLGAPIGDEVVVVVLGERVRAKPFDGHPDAPGAKHVYQMQRNEEE